MINTLANIALIIHGGSGQIHEQPLSLIKQTAYKKLISEALQAGFTLLQQGHTGVSAVETAIKFWRTARCLMQAAGLSLLIINKLNWMPP